MPRRRTGASCRCSHLIAFPSTLLFLSLILPTSSFAQLTTAAPTSSSSSTAIPTSTPSSTFSTSSTPPPEPTRNGTPPASTSANTADSNVSDHVFNYYFLIVAIVAALFGLCLLYFGRRKKRKAALMRSYSQQALAQDVASFRTRFGMRRPGFGNTETTPRRHVEEGLNDVGEAPPPYVPNTKPPSVRSADGVRPSTSACNRIGQDVELRPMNRAADGPPGYIETVAQEGDIGLARPDTVVTASERFGSTRRLISSSGSSSHRDGSEAR